MALTPEAPETDAAAPPVGEQAPVDGTAATGGSAGDANTNTVEASRFNGLMSAHQRTLSEMESLRAQVAALEARNIEETHTVAEDNAVLTEVQELRRQLQAERIEAQRVKVLDEFPDAKPFADMIIGETVEDLRSIAAAVAQRVQALTPVDPAATETPAAEAATAAGEAPGSVATEAPVVGGGSVAPATPDNGTAVSDAIAKGSWSDYWTAKSGPEATENLG